MISEIEKTRPFSQNYWGWGGREAKRPRKHFLYRTKRKVCNATFTEWPTNQWRKLPEADFERCSFSLPVDVFNKAVEQNGVAWRKFNPCGRCLSPLSVYSFFFTELNIFTSTTFSLVNSQLKHQVIGWLIWLVLCHVSPYYSIPKSVYF